MLLETGGHRSMANVPDDVIRIVDVKCPASGEADKNYWPNFDLLRPHDEVKFVILDRVDYDFAKDVIDRHDLVDLVPPCCSHPSMACSIPSCSRSGFWTTALPFDSSCRPTEYHLGRGG